MEIRGKTKCLCVVIRGAQRSDLNISLVLAYTDVIREAM